MNAERLLGFSLGECAGRLHFAAAICSSVRRRRALMQMRRPCEAPHLILLSDGREVARCVLEGRYGQLRSLAATAAVFAASFATAAAAVFTAAFTATATMFAATFAGADLGMGRPAVEGLR